MDCDDRMRREQDEDRHKAPSLPHIHPLSLQNMCGGVEHSLIRLEKSIRYGAFPMTLFGWQSSSGTGAVAIIEMKGMAIKKYDGKSYGYTRGWYESIAF
jgi:hypothetical protein